jgi:O-antigen/teichoic acid export membrane protein
MLLNRDLGWIAKWSRKGTLSIIDQALFSGSNFLVSVLLARWMTVDGYGAYGVAFSIFILVSGVHNALVRSPVSVIGAKNYSTVFPPYMKRMQAIHNLLSLGLAVVQALIGVVLALMGQPLLASAFWGLAVAQGFVLFYWLMRSAWYVENNIAVALQGTTVYAITYIASVFIFRLFMPFEPFAAFLLNGAAGIVAGLYLYIRLQQSDHDTIRLPVPLHNTLLECWKYGRWLVVYALVFWLTNNVYLTLAGAVSDLSTTGALKALQNLVNPVMQVLSAAGLVTLPWMSRRFAQRGIKQLQRDMLLITVLVTAGAIAYSAVIVIFRQEVVSLAYGSEYGAVAWVLPILAVTPILYAMTGQWTSGLLVIERAQLLLAVDTIGAIVTLTLGLYLTATYGLAGAAYGMVASVVVRIPALIVVWHMLSRDDAFRSTSAV